MARTEAIKAALISGICGTGEGAPEPGFVSFPKSRNPELQPPELANSPVASPSKAMRHQRDQRMGWNMSFSVRLTAGPMQSTGDSGFTGMGLLQSKVQTK